MSHETDVAARVTAVGRADDEPPEPDAIESFETCTHRDACERACAMCRPALLDVYGYLQRSLLRCDECPEYEG